MEYTDLLKQREWQQKCSRILNRDSFRCNDCGNIGFHNSIDSIMEINNLEEVDKLLNEWRFDGLHFSEFLNTTTQYEMDCFENVVMKNEESFNIDDMFLLKFRLYGNNSKYYNSLKAKNVYGAVLSNSNYDSLSLKSFRLCNMITNSKHNVEHSWFYYFEFEKPLINKICVSITGDNCYSQDNDFFCGNYTIKVNFENIMIVFYITSKTPLFNGLNIHHTYYIYGHTPWDYSDNALITLCEKCHKKRHANQRIPIYNEIHDILGYAYICPKCSGSGYLPEYYHVKHGVCFKCGGEGVII